LTCAESKPAGIKRQNGINATAGFFHRVTNPTHVYTGHEEGRRALVTTPRLRPHAVNVELVVAIVVSKLF